MNSSDINVNEPPDMGGRELTLAPVEPSFQGGAGSEWSAGAARRRRPPSSLRRIDLTQAIGGALLLGAGWLIGSQYGDRGAEIARLESHVTQLSAKVAGAQARAESAPRPGELHVLMEREAVQRSELASLRSKFEASVRQASTRHADLSAALAKLGKDPRFDQLAARLDRVEKQVSSSATPTGSVPSARASTAVETPAPAPSPAPAAAPKAKAGGTDHAESVPAPEVAKTEASAQPVSVPKEAARKRSQPMLDGYAVRGVGHGIALVEGRGGMAEVAPGDYLPGAGRVERIERRAGEWVVVTTQGVIAEAGF
jgi:hypothetical protein